MPNPGTAIGTRLFVNEAVGTPNSGVTSTAFGMLRGVDCYLYQIHTIREMGSREVVNVTKFEKNAADDLEATLMRVAGS